MHMFAGPLDACSRIYDFFILVLLELKRSAFNSSSFLLQHVFD